MTIWNRSNSPLFTIVLLLVLVVSACSGGASKEITIDGSSTVFPIAEVVAEEFRKENPGVQIPIGISGTGGGFKRFVNGETDISGASRAIKDSEREEAAENGIEFTEFSIAFDGLSVVMHPTNEFAKCLTVDELKAIWEPGSEINNWNQVREGFPDKKLRLYGPDTDSGTFDYFTHAINGEEDSSRSDYTASSDDNVLVQGVSGDQGSMGYFGFAYYTFNKDSLNLLAVDDGSGCISPTLETINDGTYKPLSRPMFIYVNNASFESQDMRDFITYFLKNAGELSELVGYVGLPQEDYISQLALIK
ncbi:MAG: PstS family phosphate ABC transporter substrate-binding protein [Chloroflexi bacterium]|nr:PstS family phosphate ABC transporter substrate-binding protein [Chloroflexota bacterium]MBT5628216.1 PstS family phosphate ABC transporter substrate-binding protein [Chloroflexota bacterium]